MKKYQVTWGWMPPQFDRPKGNFRLFYGKKEQTREVTHEDPETGEVTTNTINEWLCDVVEYEKSDKVIVFDLLNNPDSIECKKWMLNAQIDAYDSSSHVNSFTIGGIELWLDSNMRDKVRENLVSCEAEGLTETTLRINGMAFHVTIEQGWAMYNAVLGYARRCWNTTEEHRIAANALTTVEEVESYDYTVGYPDKLSFDIN